MAENYTIKDIAGRFGVNTQIVYRWIWAGQFPNAKKKNPFSIGKNSPYLIPAKDVEKFAAKFEKAQAQS